MNVDGSDVKRLSGGAGRTTCAFFFPDGQRYVYASTHLAAKACPPPPDRSRGYVWPIYRSYEIFAARIGATSISRLTMNDGLTPRRWYRPTETKLFLPLARGGPRHLSHEPGRLGSDAPHLTERLRRRPVFLVGRPPDRLPRASPAERGQIARFEALLERDLIRPTRAEIFIMDVDGSAQRQVTANGAANWAPFLHPDNRHVVLSSNLHDPERRTFSLYSIGVDGKGLRRISDGARFDSFPMLSRHGTKLVFASTRNAPSGDFKIFIADWEP